MNLKPIQLIYRHEDDISYCDVPGDHGGEYFKADDVRERMAELDDAKGKLESAHNPKSVGNIAWLASQYLRRAEDAERELSATTERVKELERAAQAKDKVIADCERMLRFAPPPKHLGEDNQWHAAISAAQAELQMGRPGQQPTKSGVA